MFSPPNISFIVVSSTTSHPREMLSLAHSLLCFPQSMLSLAKLSLLASGEAERSDQRALLDAELDLVAHQEDLPESVLIAYGYDIDALHVLPPAELIQVIMWSNFTGDAFVRLLN